MIFPGDFGNGDRVGELGGMAGIIIGASVGATIGFFSGGGYVNPLSILTALIGAGFGAFLGMHILGLGAFIICYFFGDYLGALIYSALVTYIFFLIFPYMAHNEVQVLGIFALIIITPTAIVWMYRSFQRDKTARIRVAKADEVARKRAEEWKAGAAERKRKEEVWQKEKEEKRAMKAERVKRAKAAYKAGRISNYCEKCGTVNPERCCGYNCNNCLNCDPCRVGPQCQSCWDYENSD